LLEKYVSFTKFFSYYIFSVNVGSLLIVPYSTYRWHLSLRYTDPCNCDQVVSTG